jgi:pyrimidine nucleoside transport protein
MICSYVLWPLAVVIGVDVDDCRKVGSLFGTKIFYTELVAYKQLAVFVHNRQLFDSHVTSGNGTWYADGDDVILTSPFNSTVLTGGLLTVGYASLKL